MGRAIAIERLTLHAAEQTLGLRQATDKSFFLEWQTSLPLLTDFEKDRLAHIRTIYDNFAKRSAIEKTVNLTIVSPLIVSPLLDTAGLFLPPFYIETERSVEITAKDRDATIKGRLDIVIVKDSFWILTIESKRAEFSPTVGIPQVLAYMLAAPTVQNQLYGMVTNGRNFIFVKLDRTSADEPIYMESKEFIINQDTDLEQILKIIKQLGAIAVAQP